MISTSSNHSTLISCDEYFTCTTSWGIWRGTLACRGVVDVHVVAPWLQRLRHAMEWRRENIFVEPEWLWSEPAVNPEWDRCEVVVKWHWLEVSPEWNRNEVELNSPNTSPTYFLSSFSWLYRYNILKVEVVWGLESDVLSEFLGAAPVDCSVTEWQDIEVEVVARRIQTLSIVRDFLFGIRGFLWQRRFGGNVEMRNAQTGIWSFVIISFDQDYSSHTRAICIDSCISSPHCFELVLLLDKSRMLSVGTLSCWNKITKLRFVFYV